MNQKQSKRLRRLIRQTDPEGKISRSRYQTLKTGWNKTPVNQRGGLMDVLEKASDGIRDQMNQSKQS